MDSLEPAPKSQVLTDLQFDILRMAVDVARSRHVRKVATLKEILLRHFPNQEEDIDAAIRCWARRVRETYA